MLNPYWNQNFCGFFITLLSRFFALITGQLSFSELVSDEIQLLVLLFISLSCAIVGVFLVLKKMAMLTNALSHTILIGIVAVFVLFQVSSSLQMGLFPLFVASVITAMVTALLTQALHHIFSLQEDASIGLVFTFLFALGIIMATLFTKNAHIGIEAVMGNADALQLSDVKQSFFVFIVNFSLIFLLFRPYLISSFDPFLAKSFGFFPKVFHYLFLLQVSWTALCAFRAVGVLLVLEFFVCPFMIARQFSHRMPILILISALISAFISSFSIALNRHLLTTTGLAFSTSSVVAVVMGAVTLAVLLLKKKRVLRC